MFSGQAAMFSRGAAMLSGRDALSALSCYRRFEGGVYLVSQE